MSQGKMKALLHNQVLDQLLKKIAPEKPKAILVDQFELPSTYFKHISDQKVQVKENIHFRPKANPIIWRLRRLPSSPATTS